ncbi:hypothetical protein KCU95_g7692, partial [Aureobasidium melanogenum]
MTFLLRRRRRTRDGSTDCIKRGLDDNPPPYSDSRTTITPKQDEDLVRWLQSFITQRLVSEYGLSSELGCTNNDDIVDQKYYLDLCRQYCLLLGAQSDSRHDVVARKQELMKVIFEPAKMLGIPAEVMEYFLFSTRMLSKAYPEMDCFNDIKVCNHTKTILLRLAIDYTIIIDAAVAEEPDSPWPAAGTVDPRKASVGRKLKNKCLAFHQQFYPWMLDLRLINLEQIVKELKEKDKDADVPVHCKSATLPGRTYHDNVNARWEALIKAYDKKDNSVESTHKQASSTSFSTEFPSFLLPYRQHTSWPLVTALSYQAIRPCSALAPPSTSYNLRILFSDFHHWRKKSLRDPNTCFQPTPMEIFYKRRFECGLPNGIRVGHMEFKNPDGGAPKSVLEDGDFGDSWESRYVRERLEKRCSVENALAEQDLVRTR